ncbi:MAG: hypothetical protein ACXADY_23545 [Candidatus Hodarchaeales archaeon]|jgi:hypothetical protein
MQLREQLLKKITDIIKKVQNQEPEILTSFQEYSSQIEQVIIFLRQFQTLVNQIIKENQVSEEKDSEKKENQDIIFLFHEIQS